MKICLISFLAILVFTSIFSVFLIVAPDSYLNLLGITSTICCRMFCLTFVSFSSLIFISLGNKLDSEE